MQTKYELKVINISRFPKQEQFRQISTSYKLKNSYPLFCRGNGQGHFWPIFWVQWCHRRSERGEKETQSYGYDIRTEDPARIIVYSGREGVSQSFVTS